MSREWVLRLIRRQPLRVLGTALGVAVAVSLLGSVGSFLAHARSTMTARAASSVPVDWQVQVSPGADPSAVGSLVAGTPGVVSTAEVGFARVPGLTSAAAGVTSSTGAATVVGLPPGYAVQFPGSLRVLSGNLDGPVLAQQTASNLHAAPGWTVTVSRPGLPPYPVTVAGVVDLPQANSFFQTVGAPPGAQPSAPPDNVLLLPHAAFAALARPLAAARPDLVTTQVHARLDRRLPHDPTSAYTAVVGAARHLEARSAGTAVVGNDLAAALDGARGDAAYAQILFGFLALPGAVLAGLLTVAVAAASAQRRRDEQALLRLRGASERQLMRLALAESATTGAIGCAVGLAAAALVGLLAFGSTTFGATTTSSLLWALAAVAAGALITALALVLPARRDARGRTVAGARHALLDVPRPSWRRYGFDVVALVVAALVWSATTRKGYTLVLAPEGVPTVSVSSWALTAPALLWLGAGLLLWRLYDGALARGARLLGWLVRPLAGRLSPLLGASVARQRTPVVRAAVLLALTGAFAVSTATFNTTYRVQAEADAQLTNGADVTVTTPPGADLGPDAVSSLTRVAGVRHVEPLQHRFAYVGADLQDLYGVNPTTVRSATALQDSYLTGGGSATTVLQRLAAQRDTVLVSAETVKDYQLRLGDRLNLRLDDARTHRLVTVPFRFGGIVSEFPTAPRDSFLVANASYVARATGSDRIGSFLVDTGGHDQAAVAARVTRVVGPGAVVTDITSVRRAVGSSLTAVDLAGLSRVELVYAVLLAVAAGGLLVLLGLVERRRALAVLRALGAGRRHLLAAVAAETLVTGLLGVVGGVVLGSLLAHVLAQVLTGVFDPPPSALSVPWTYLVSLLVVVLAALAALTRLGARLGTRQLLTVIRRG